MAERVPINNPTDSGKVAHFLWGGKPYQIQPGETQMMEEHLAQHARKHNNFLRLLDDSVGSMSYAESQVKICEDKVQSLSAELQTKTAELKRAQVEMLAARNRLKAEQELQEKHLAEGKPR